MFILAPISCFLNFTGERHCRNLTSPFPITAGVEAVKRTKNGQDILNHNNYPAEFALPGAFQDLISGERLQNRLTLKPKDTVILKKA